MQRAKEIFLKSKKDVTNLNFGLNLSKFGSDGLDFSEIRDYSNDDVKKINWKATARSMELKTNIFNETKQLNIVIAFMLSGSLNFGSSRLKFDLATEILSLLSLAGVISKNIIYPYVFSDRLEFFIEPIVSEDGVFELVNTLLGSEILGKEPNFKALCDTINLAHKKRSMVFIISDFLSSKVDISEIAYYNDVYALCIRDRAEEDISMFGELNFIDPTNFGAFETNLDKSSVRRYKELLKAHDDRLMGHFFENSVSFAKFYSDDDIVHKFLGLMR